MPDQPLSFLDVLNDEYREISGKPDFSAASEQEFYKKTEDTSLSALCISGGGIRSATFALGALQQLAKQGILETFDYLSTVSGGGYIGSWLTAWKDRKNGLNNINDFLKPGAPAPNDGTDPVQHLREYNNYLSPKLGFFSADTWTLVATVARNMFLNWLVFVPLLMAALMIPRLILSLSRLGEALKAYYGEHWLKESHLEYLWPLLGAIAFAVAVRNALRYLPGVGGKNHTETVFLKYCLFPLILAVLAFMTLESWFTGGDETGPTDLTYGQLILWITVSLAVGWIAYLFGNFREAFKKKRQLLGLTVAIVLAGFSTASCAWLLVSKLYPWLSWPVYVTVAPPLLLIGFILAIVLFVGLTSNVLEDDDREWLSRAGAWLLLFILGWTGLCSLVLLAPIWVLHLGAWINSSFATAGGIGGIITARGGFSLKSKTSTASGKPGDNPPSNSKLINLALQLAALVFVVVFAVSLSILTNWLLSITSLVPGDWTDHRQFTEDTKTRWVLLSGFAFFAFGWFMAKFININKFSLHAMYRNRLIRAYLGASNQDSNINKFIGFDHSDNLQMRDLKVGLKPFHIVNITLNLVSGRRLAWQQRKAESFTVSRLHCGSANLNYRPSAEYGGDEGISLGTAVTISGAAASPNMGYHSSPILGFIMTLFNARLGAWLGNPGPAGNKTWKKPGPSSAVDSIVREAFGLTNDTSPYVYLSDGGHFENLGLYEMIKRRCRFILVLDGGADPTLGFDDLGNALRKVRIDTRISIDFDGPWVQPMRDRTKRWAVARIGYQAAGLGEDGFLVYVKPLMSGTEPPDLFAYHEANTDFPHQSTADQFFDESQTESYRMLGLHSIREMFEGWKPETGLPGLVNLLQGQKGLGAAGGK